MRTSESISNLAAALALAQGQVAVVGRDSWGQEGNRRYRYVTLGALIGSVRKALADNKLAIVQVVDHGEETVLTTRLMHASGEWIEASWPLPHYDKPQAQGSVITYWRRYQLQSLLGIAADEDDDGAAAQADKPATPAPQPVQAEPSAESAIVTATAEVLRHKAAVKAWAPSLRTVKAAHEAVLNLVREVQATTGATNSDSLATDTLTLMAQIAAGAELESLDEAAS